MGKQPAGKNPGVLYAVRAGADISSAEEGIAGEWRFLSSQ